MTPRRFLLLLTAAPALASTLTAEAADDKPVLRIYAWSEYLPDWLLEEFEKSTGITVELRTYASNEELLTRRLGNGSFDLIQPTDYVVEGLVTRGMLEPLDTGAIPNLKHLDPAYAELPHDRGGRFSVPWMAGTVGILYDTRRIREPIRGCTDLFSGKHTGRIASIDDPRQLVSLAMASLDLPANQITPESLDKAAPVLEGWMRQIVFFDSDTPGKAVAAGDVDAALVWSGEAAALIREAPSLAYVFPSEGTFRFVDCFCIPKGSKNKALAHRFLNFILEPEVSARASDDYPYTNPNATAVARLTEAQRRNPASFPPPGVTLEPLRDIGDMGTALALLYAKLREKILKDD
jgi:spermidine/putrescine transport system substrate-binding protein